MSADFREQALREHIPKIDAVLITHCHSDHITGIPDVPADNDPAPHVLDFYGSTESMNAIEQSFSYIFSAKTFVGGPVTPRLALHEALAQFQLFGLPIVPIPVLHGTLQGCLLSHRQYRLCSRRKINSLIPRCERLQISIA